MFFVLLSAITRFILIFIVTGATIKEKPTAHNNSLLDSKLVNIGNIFYQLVQTLQYCVLLHGMYKFWKYMLNPTTKDSKAFDSVYYKYMPTMPTGWKKCCICVSKIIVATVMIFIYISIFIAAPILLSLWFDDFVLWYDLTLEKCVAGAYASLAWVRHLSDLVLHWAMIVATRLAVLEWSAAKHKLLESCNETKAPAENKEQENGVTTTASVVDSEPQNGVTPTASAVDSEPQNGVTPTASAVDSEPQNGVTTTASAVDSEPQNGITPTASAVDSEPQNGVTTTASAVDSEPQNGVTTTASASNKINELFDSYKEVGKKVAALNGIFQGWFIIQWAIFFVAVTGKGTLLLKSLLDEEYAVELYRFIYISVHVAFDIFAFLIPYILGVIINSKHNDFYELLTERKEDILSKETDEHMKMMIGLDLIPKQSKYEFLPTLSVISIPLDSGSYILTIVLAVFTFIATFLVTFADISKI